MPSLVFDVSALDRASQAFNRIADRIDMLVARLAALNGASATARVDVDTDPADRTLGRWTMDFRRRVREAMATIEIDVDLAAGATNVEREMGRIRRELAQLLDKKIGVDIDGDEAVREIERLKAQLTALDTANADIQVRADVAAAIAALEAVLAEARRVDGTEAEVKVKADSRGIRDIINATALLQRSIAQLSRPIGIVGAIPGIVSLLQSLTELLGLLGLLPALAFAGAASIAALVTAFDGFGAALGAMGDLEKFNEALKELTPNAAEAATAIREIFLEFQGIQDIVQENFFEGIGESIQLLGNQYLPTISAGLQGVAAEFGGMFNQWAEWAAQAETVQQTGVIFENLRATIQNLGPAFTNIAAALTDMVEVGMSMLPNLANGFTDATQRFEDFIARVTANGQFEAWVQRAIDTLGQLINIGGNLWGAFQGFFTAAEAAGAGFLNTLETLTEALDEFVNSAQGQEGITAFFVTIRDVVNNLLPGLQAIGGAFLEAFVVAGPALADVANALSDIATAFASVLPTLAGVGSLFAPFISAIGDLIALLGPFPGYVLAAFVVFRVAGAILTAFSGFLTAAALRVEAFALSLISLGSAGAVGSALGGLGVALGGVVTAFRGLAAFLAGPFGIAILGAIAVIGLLSSGEDEAAAAAQRHQSAVQGIIGTLDQYSGAVTEATQQQIALDLAQRKMSDGTTSLVTAVQQAGINFQQFTQAASGNEVALRVVNAQLVTAADSMLKTADAADLARDLVGKGRFTWEDYTLAVLGNIPALERVQAGMGGSEIATRDLIEAGRDAVGTLDEVAMTLGDTAGALDEAQAAAVAAADAQADFGARLRETQGALAEYGGIIDDVTGAFDPSAAGAAALAESFRNLGQDALGTARNLARVAEAQDGLQAGGAAAAASMATSRQAFIEMATSAGIGVEAANRLADAMGLIPEVAEIIFETNADETQADLIQIAGAILAMPEAKQIVIDAPTAEVLAALDALGIAITELPNGQVLLDLNDAEFQAKLQAAIEQGMSIPMFLAFLGLDTSIAQAEMDAWQAANPQLGETISWTLELETDGATAGLQAWKEQAEADSEVIAALYMETGEADAELDAFVARANTAVLEPDLMLDDAPFQAVLAAAIAAANAALGMMTLDANSAPAMAKLAAAVAAVNAALGTMTIDANPAPAIGKLADTKGAVDRTVGMMKIDADPGPALAKAAGAVAAINRMTATITVTTREITVKETRTVRGTPEVSGGGVMRFARGGIVPGYAPGLDSIPALLSPGEAVLVPEVVRLLGQRAIIGLNKLASGGRKATMLSRTGADAYWSYGTAGGRSMGAANGGGSPVVKNYILNLTTTSGEVNLREQFRRMEVLGV